MESKAIFDINRSVITLCQKKEPRTKVKIFGKEIEIIDSDEDENLLARKAITESFQPLLKPSKVEVEDLKY